MNSESSASEAGAVHDKPDGESLDRLRLRRKLQQSVGGHQLRNAKRACTVVLQAEIGFQSGGSRFSQANAPEGLDHTLAQRGE
jgi:hypothetical protein